MLQIDIQVLNALKQAFGNQARFATVLNINCAHTLSNWKQRGIPSAWRPTVWALLEGRCPDVAASLDRDEFLGVRIPAVVDADTAA